MVVRDRSLDLGGLRDVHETTRLGRYLDAVWARRNYIWYVSTSELRSRQMNSVLGNLWYLLNPILQISVYFLIFGIVLKVDRGLDNFIVFLTIGTLVFAYTQRSTLAGAKSLVGNLGLIRAVSFPRAVLPITSTLTETIALVPSLVVIVSVSLATGETPSPRWLLLLPVLATMMIFNLGAAMIAARATSHIRDVTQILPFLFRILLYGSGVLFSAEAYTSGAYKWLFNVNPIYCFLTMSRWTILGGSLDPVLLLSAAIWTATLVVGGFLWFRSAEATYGRN